MEVKPAESFVREVFARFVEDRCQRMAAGLAYFTIFSLPALLLVLLSLVGAIFESGGVEARLLDQIALIVGDKAARAIQTMVENVAGDSRGPLAGVLGGLVLLVGGTGAFVQLQGALNDAWQVAPDPERSGVRDIVAKRLLSLALVLAIGFLLLVSLVASAVVATLGGWIETWVPSWVSHGFLVASNTALSFTLATLVFAAIFKVLPDARIAWKTVWVGALLTALLFGVGKFLLGFYLGRSDLGSTYGAAGSLVVLMVWTYYVSLIVLLGAEVTQVWARRSGLEIVPEEGAVRVVRYVGSSGGAGEATPASGDEEPP